MGLNARREAQDAGGDSFVELRRALALKGQMVSGGWADESICSKLEVLERRLARVHSWGGRFSEVDFSQEVRAILQRASAMKGVTKNIAPRRRRYSLEGKR